MNPLREQHERIKTVLDTMTPLILLGFMGGMLFYFKGLEEGLESSNPLIPLVAFGSLVLISSAWGALNRRINKARARAVRAWVDQANPSTVELARLSISHEAAEAERMAARKVLDKRNRHWRAEALAGAAPPTTSVQDIPKIEESSAGQDLISGGLTLLVVASITLAAYGIFSSTPGADIWLWVGAALTVLSAFLIYWFIERPDAVKREAWEYEMSKRLSFSQAVLFEATNADTAEGLVVRRWLDKTYPGWTLSPERPVWSVVCACDDTH